MIDFGAQLYDPVYAALGVPARLMLDDTAGTTVDLTVIDNTAGAVVNDSAHGVAIETIKPAVSVRGAELVANDVTPAMLRGATVTLRPDDDASQWTVEAYQLKPSPSGELAGEVLLILVRA